MVMPVNRSEDLKPDEEGYYPVVLSFLSSENQNGQFIHPLTEDQVKGLNGREPIMGMISRKMHGVRRIGLLDHIALHGLLSEVRISHAVKDITATLEEGPLGYMRQVVRGKIKPESSVSGQFLQDQLNDPRGQVSFGIRAYTEPVNPEEPSVLRINELICWDLIDVHAQCAEVVNPNPPT